MDLNFISFLYPVFWIKIITLIMIGFYIIFTLVVFTQVKVMSQIIHLPSGETMLKTISVINILLAVSLFVGAFVIL